MGDSRERRHQHPVHPLLRVLLTADRDDRRRLPRAGRPARQALHRPRWDLGDRRAAGRQRARLPVGALAGLRVAREGPDPPAAHFAQINEKDGFFLTGRAADPAFSWDKLRGKRVLVDHGGQPLAMFKFACHKRGLDYAAIQSLDVAAGQMDGAFRKGEGDYIHQQGPAPQQLEHDKVGHVVASVGEAIGPVAFSSLAATREWLRTDMARRFMRAIARRAPG
jgi:ABC-type nitrate/sulfonate/bicarbonate transport system substrate-binding protein